MKKNIALVISMIAVAISVGTSVSAKDGLRDVTRDITNEVSRTVENTVTGTTKTVDDTVKTTIESSKERSETQKERVEQHRSELTEKLEAKLDDRKQKLEGRRLALCQNRQAKINKLLDDSSAIGSRHLENLQKLESRVTAFADKKAITSQVYQDARFAADQKEAAAIAALQVLDANNFDCSAVDASDPSNSVSQLRDAKRTALSEYRDAVIQLIHVVKDEFTATQQNKAEQ